MRHVVGAWHWATLIVKGSRCYVCGKRYRWHTPWESWRCNRAPLAILLPEHERKQVAS
jgi:hypothetical protein